MTNYSLEKSRPAARISKVLDRRNITPMKKSNRQPRAHTLQNFVLGLFIFFVLLIYILGLPINMIKHVPFGLQNHNFKTHHTNFLIFHNGLNRIFVRNMQRATQGFNPSSGGGGGGFWKTLKRVTGTPLQHNVQGQRHMSAFSVYHDNKPKLVKDAISQENPIVNGISVPNSLPKPIEKPLIPIPPVKHPKVLSNDHDLFDPEYIPNMRLTHKIPSLAIQKKYGFTVTRYENLGPDPEGKTQYLIGIDKPVTLEEMKEPGKHDVLTEHLFGKAGELDPTSPNYARWFRNRTVAVQMEKLLIVDIKFREYSKLEEINRRQVERLEKTLEEKEQKQAILNMTTTNQNQIQHPQTDNNTSLAKIINNENT